MNTDEFIARYNKGEINFIDIFLIGGEQTLKQKYLPGLEIKGGTIHELDFEGANLEGANFQQVNFEYVNFKQVNLKKCTLKEVNSKGQNFEIADLERAKLYHAQFQGANFRNAKLQKSSLVATNFRGADLPGANFQGANLKETILEDIIYDETTTWDSVRNLIKSLISDRDREYFRLYLDTLSSFITDNYIEINGIKTIDTFQKAKKQINRNINEIFSGRKGQAKFREALLKAYNYRCAITGCEIEEALEAAHIIPYCLTQNNNISNGVLLRADLHTLLDFNLITIEPELKIVHFHERLTKSNSYSFEKLKRINSSNIPPISISPPLGVDSQLWQEALEWRYEKYQDFLD